MSTSYFNPNKPAYTNPIAVTDGSDGYELCVAIDQTLTGTALADNLANPTVNLEGSCLLVYDGVNWERVKAYKVFKDLNTVTISSVTTVWTPASGKKVRLLGGTISVSVAGSVLFTDSTASTTIFRTPVLQAGSPYNFDLGALGVPLSAANDVLAAQLSVSGSVTGTLFGTEE